MLKRSLYAPRNALLPSFAIWIKFVESPGPLKWHEEQKIYINQKIVQTYAGAHAGSLTLEHSRLDATAMQRPRWSSKSGEFPSLGAKSFDCWAELVAAETCPPVFAAFIAILEDIRILLKKNVENNP
jgi:hypothetical protein